MASGDEEEAAKWAEGGAYRVALHTGVGALTGNLEGAAGAFVSAEAMNVVAGAIDQMGLPQGVKQGLEQVAAAAMGAIAGGGAGAAAGVNVEANNRQLHQSERDWAKDNTEKYRKYLENKTGEEISAEEAYQRLLSAGYAIVDIAAEKGGKSDETAKQFIAENKTSSEFNATAAERANPFQNGNADGPWTPEQQARFGARNPTEWANDRVAAANELVGKPCDNPYACGAKVDNIVKAVDALEQKKALYQDDPKQLQQIEAQQGALLGGMTAEDIEQAKLAEADQSTLLEMLGMASGPALAGDLAGAIAKFSGAKGAAAEIAGVNSAAAGANARMEAGSAANGIYTDMKPMGTQFPELEGVNPHYVDGAGLGVNTNCVSCVNASQARLTGTDATAVASPSTGYANQNSLLPSAPFGLQPPTSVTVVTQQMTTAGDGAVGVVLVQQPGGVSHVINVVNQGGKVFFVDTQMGKIVTLNPSLTVQLGQP
jgi:hypothetical protein